MTGTLFEAAQYGLLCHERRPGWYLTLRLALMVCLALLLVIALFGPLYHDSTGLP